MFLLEKVYSNIQQEPGKDCVIGLGDVAIP